MSVAEKIDLSVENLTMEKNVKIWHKKFRKIERHPRNMMQNELALKNSGKMKNLAAAMNRSGIKGKQNRKDIMIL